ncbi:MAG: trypsin-like peptidase domain-containing protein [Bosea sp.]|nr:trypsin-like peptidase domain-containing protein [Bosea sp. (in: a-proteobacteria)]
MLGRFAEPRTVAPRGDLAASEQSSIAIFETARDSVVFITTAERVVDPWTRNAYDAPSGSGSGFVWDELGHVVTNNHVIAAASGAIVRLADGRAFPARLVGRAPEHDLAVLHIGVGAGRPAPISVGTSRDLRVGQNVFAIGNPFGLDWTMTTGIVSALNRELPDDGGRPIRGLIQTDAAINPGNSGGPLLDSAGRLIGVNTAIYSPSGGSAGIGFAVPVDTVNRVVPQLIARGRYAPPNLGIQVDPRVDAALAGNGAAGVLVLGIDPKGPAAQAGLIPTRVVSDGRIVVGDRIIGLGDSKIDDTSDLIAALERYIPGNTVDLLITRGGQQLRVAIALGSSS